MCSSLALAFGIGWLAWLSAPRRDLGAVYFFVVLPIVSYVLLSGAPLLGLADVPTALWGGILVTIVVATVGIVASLPLGIMLALGRRSDIPVGQDFRGDLHRIRPRRAADHRAVHGERHAAAVRAGAVSPDKLVRALIGVALFASAYMAEVVRGGLRRSRAANTRRRRRSACRIGA